MKGLNVHIHRSYAGLLSSLQRQNKRDKSLIEKVYSSGLNNQEQPRRKPFQHDNSLPRPFTGEVVRQKSKVVNKIRKVIEQKKTKEKEKKEGTMEQIHLLEKFIFTCKNFMNSCSRLIKSYAEVINDQDPIVKTVLSNRLELSRIVHDIQKHNIFRMEQENEELKKMIDRLKKMMSLSKYKQTQVNVNQLTLHKDSYELIKKILKQRFELKDYLDFERVIETSERQIKIKSILTEKNLCAKSEKKFLELLETIEKEKGKVFNNLLKNKNSFEEDNTNQQQMIKQGYEIERVLNKKLKQLLEELNVQITTNSTITMFELLEIKVINMRAQLIPSLNQSSHSYTMQINKLKQEVQNKTNELEKSKELLDSKILQLDRKSHQLNVKVSQMSGMEKENRRLQQQLKDVQWIESVSTLHRFKQPDFKQFNSLKKIEEVEEQNKMLEKLLRKYENELKSLCESHGIVLDNEQDSKYSSLLESVDMWMISYTSNMMEIEKQNAFNRRKIEDIEQQFQNVIRDKLRCEEEIELLRNKNKEYEVVCKQRLELERKKSNSEKQKERQIQAGNVMRVKEWNSMRLNDYEGEIGRLRQNAKKYEGEINDLESKVRMRDEINQQMMQQKMHLQEQCEEKVKMISTLGYQKCSFEKQKAQMGAKIQHLQITKQLIGKQKQQKQNKIEGLEKQVSNLTSTIKQIEIKLDIQSIRQKQLNNKLVQLISSFNQIKMIKNEVISFKQSLSCNMFMMLNLEVSSKITTFIADFVNSSFKNFTNQISSGFSSFIQQKQAIILKKIQFSVKRIDSIDLQVIHAVHRKHINMTHTFQTQTQIPELFIQMGTCTQNQQMQNQQTQTEEILTAETQINTDECMQNFLKKKQQSKQRIQNLNQNFKQLKRQCLRFSKIIRSEVDQYKSYQQENSRDISQFVNKNHSDLQTLFKLIEAKLKLQFNPRSLQQCISILSKFQYKEPSLQCLTNSFLSSTSSQPYYETLEKMLQQFLYNKVNLNLQQQIKALPQHQKQKMNAHKKKIGEMQNQLTVKEQLTDKILELNKQIQALKNEQKNVEKKIQYYQQDNIEKQSQIQQLKSNNKQILNCMQIPNDTLSLIGQQDSSETGSNLNQILLFDLLDQSGICNDELQFTKTELTKALKQLNAVKGKLRVLDKNSRQIINYLKLSIMSMIEAIESSKDDTETLKNILNELKGCKSNIK